MQTVLIVEDEKDLAELIAFHPGKEGFHLLIVGDGASGLREARSAKPDLVLLDLMLPGMMGTEVCRLLKGSEQTAGIPVIMLTAKGEEIDRVVDFEVGAGDYLVNHSQRVKLCCASGRCYGDIPIRRQRGALYPLANLAIDTGGTWSCHEKGSLSRKGAYEKTLQKDGLRHFITSHSRS